MKAEQVTPIEMSHQGYRSLVVWQEARQLAIRVYLLTRKDSFSRDWALTDRLRRSALSVPSNIAEGDERESDRDSVRFFHIAKGSLAELATQLDIASEVGCLPKAEAELLLTTCNEPGRKLGALVKARSRRFQCGTAVNRFDEAPLA